VFGFCLLFCLCEVCARCGQLVKDKSILYQEKGHKQEMALFLQRFNITRVDEGGEEF
jgi:hypothetical protein